jgi:hypothetical protein
MSAAQLTAIGGIIAAVAGLVTAITALVHSHNTRSMVSGQPDGQAK